MVHDTSLIVTIAAGLSLAFLFGVIAAKVGLPPLLGYLMAGLAVGPFTPGIMADSAVAQQLSEIGVTLLMFGVGLHFSIKDLWAVRKVAIPGAIVQIAVATTLGLALGTLFNMKFGAGLVFGLCLSVASTVVLLRALNDRNLMDSANGRIAIGWLVVEDLVTVLALVALPALSGSLGGTQSSEQQSVALTLGMTFLKVTAFVGLMLIIGKRVIPAVLGRVASSGSRELFTLGVVAIALGIAFGSSALFGVSPALGAFFAGIVIAESDLSHRANAEILPLQETFTVLFFVAVGMLFNPYVLVEHPLQVFAALVIVTVGKSVAAAAIVLLFRYPIATALVISASLAQIGEFSFILASLGLSLGLIRSEALSVILAVGVLSIGLNPLVFSLSTKLTTIVERNPKWLKLCEGDTANIFTEYDQTTDALKNHAIMVGFGRVGAVIGAALSRTGVPYVVVDLDREVINMLQENQIPTIFGDASRPGVLEHAHLNSAAILIVATPAKSQAREIVQVARNLRPDLKICVRTHHAGDVSFFDALRIERVVLGELETALEMAGFAMSATHSNPQIVSTTIDDLRQVGAKIMETKHDCLPEASSS